MLRASDIMETSVILIRSSASLLEAAEIMLAKGINGLPVVSGEGKLVGVIGIKDILRMPHRQAGRSYVVFYPGFERRARLMSQLLVSEVMSTPVVAVSEDATVSEVLAIVLDRGIHPVPVLREGELVGIIGRADLVRVMVGLASATPLDPSETA